MSWRSCPVAGCGKRLTETDFRDHSVRGHGWTDAQVSEQLRRWRRADRMFDLRIRWPHMRDWTFDSFPADDAAGRRALDLMQEWVDPADVRAWRRQVLIHGPPGTGKTGLAFAAARFWAETENVVFVNVRKLLADQRARFGRNGATEPVERAADLERLLDIGDGNGDLVVLDDLGAERPTEYALETISLLVEHLYMEEAAQIVTTNYAPAALAERLGRPDRVVGQRIVSRLLEDALLIQIDRPDQRMRTIAAKALLGGDHGGA